MTGICTYIFLVVSQKCPLFYVVLTGLYKIYTKSENQAIGFRCISSFHFHDSWDWFVQQGQSDLKDLQKKKSWKMTALKLYLICPFKLPPLIIINLLHYISIPNYMCYKGIIALKDAYRDPSSLQSVAKFSLVINRGVNCQEVLTSKDLAMKFKEHSFRPLRIIGRGIFIKIDLCAGVD